MARLARLATAQDYTVVDIRNVSQSLIRQMEWLEQEIQASANRVVQLEDNGDDEAEGPAQAAAPQVNNDELRADVQKKLTPLWQGSLKLTLSDSNQQLVYAIERVRVAQLHRRDIIGAKITLNEPEKVLDMLMITPECAKVTTLGTNMDLEAKLAQLQEQLIS
ncbi:YALIA101S01e09472g1_1 [Yarrowia lipolytica]|nr:YALIA101S01e09472g1_1 [Yarrowia lipolytica]VBB85699.1 Hypothetical protein conserved in the Yarrowia clade [Yarrowia lipolytica]